MCLTPSLCTKQGQAKFSGEPGPSRGCVLYNRDVDSPTCSRCGASLDRSDNFCRRCGHQLTVNLPVVRQSSLPVRAPSLPPSLIGSIAVLAVGTGLEWLARRLAGSAARAAGRAVLRPERSPAATTPHSNDTVTVDEVLYVRKIQLRR